MLFRIMIDQLVDAVVVTLFGPRGVMQATLGDDQDDAIVETDTLIINIHRKAKPAAPEVPEADGCEEQLENQSIWETLDELFGNGLKGE